MESSKNTNNRSENKQKKHPWPLLILSIIFLGLVGYAIFNFPPNYNFQINFIKIPIIIPFFIFIFLGVYSFVAYFTISFLQGLVFSVAVILYLVLRFFGLGHPLFGLLLLAMLISIEFAIYKKK